MFEFLFQIRHLKHGPTLGEFLGASLSSEEYALKRPANAPKLAVFPSQDAREVDEAPVQRAA